MPLYRLHLFRYRNQQLSFQFLDKNSRLMTHALCLYAHTNIYTAYILVNIPGMFVSPSQLPEDVGFSKCQMDRRKSFVS